MNSNFKHLLLTLILGLFVTTFVAAQSNPSANFSSDSGILLSPDHPLSKTYNIDISSQGWTIEEARTVIVYFTEQSNLIDMELDYPSKKVILTLLTDAPEAKGWDIEKWSEHLARIR